MTLSLAVHPHFGREITVVRMHGEATVVIELEDGRTAAVPVAWTTLRPRAPTPVHRGAEVRIEPEVALELSKWVAARAPGREKVAPMLRSMAEGGTDAAVRPDAGGARSIASLVEQAGAPRVRGRAKRGER